MTEDDLRDLAEEIRSGILNLVPDPAQALALDTDLARALALERGTAKAELRRALAGHPVGRRLLRDRFDDGDGYLVSPLAGDTTRIPYRRWACPIADCPEDFFQDGAHEPVPPCPVHGQPMAEEPD